MDSIGLNVFGLAFLLVMLGLTVTLPRRTAVVPLLVTAAYMPMGQALVVGGVSFQILRVLLAIGWLRVVINGEAMKFKACRIDKSFVAWGLVSLIVGAFTQPSEFSERLINRAGEAYNAFGAYFLIRCWVRTLDDVIRIIRILAVVVIPLAGLVMLEKLTGRNAFSVFGGVPEFTAVREGKLRCQGAFRHPILAGTYGATLVPLFFGLWQYSREFRKRAAIGICGAVTIAVASASSGALLTLCGVAIGFGLWRIRAHMRALRWSCALALLVLHFSMKAPVWFLIGRLSDIAGGTGWYRSYNIDVAVSHFNEWWLTGTRYTAHWAPGGEVMAGNAGNMDILNQFVSEGLDGGVLKLGLFIWLICVSFGGIGLITNQKRLIQRPVQRFAWALGVCLGAHCISFFSVVYFDQIVLMWYVAIAAIAAIVGSPMREKMSRSLAGARAMRVAPEDMGLKIGRVELAERSAAAALPVPVHDLFCEDVSSYNGKYGCADVDKRVLETVIPLALKDSSVRHGACSLLFS